MSEYQTLLDEAVALVNADRGFIVFCDSASGEPDQYVATHDFDPALFQPSETLNEHQYTWRYLLPDILNERKPLLTSNVQTTITEGPKTSPIDWILRSVIAIPLYKADGSYGLLWCDQSILRKGLWTEQNMEQVAALVQQFLRTA